MPATGAGERSAAANTEAVVNALKLVQGQLGAQGEGPRTPQLPTARSRVAIDRVAGLGTYTALEATRPDLKQLVSNVLDWQGHTTSRVTKPLTRALGAGLAGTAGTESSYPQAVEMLSFLALCAPMLEPDRLVRIANLVTSTQNAYRPIRYLAEPAKQLQQLLARYNDQRKEKLLASLWVTAHDGRWWDATASVPLAHRRRARQLDQLDPAQREVVRQQVDMLMQRGGKPSVRLVCQAFESSMLGYTEQAAQILGRLSVRSDADRRNLAVFVKHPDADIPVLLSYVPGLHPDDRPESPIVALISLLTRELAETITQDDGMPAKPEEWANLYPTVSREGFPMPNAIRNLGDAPLPGLPEAKVRMVLSPAGLQANATHMGNCTFGYRDRCSRGVAFIGHAELDGVEYNFAVEGRRVHPETPATWTLGQVNSRFNRGDVPGELRDALRARLAQVNAQQ